MHYYRERPVWSRGLGAGTRGMRRTMSLAFTDVIAATGQNQIVAR
jgi:hypothetical protein